MFYLERGFRCWGRVAIIGHVSHDCPRGDSLSGGCCKFSIILVGIPHWDMAAFGKNIYTYIHIGYITVYAITFRYMYVGIYICRDYSIWGKFGTSVLVVCMGE